MKTQRKIITDRPKISDSEILSQRKPFKEILKNYYNGASGFTFAKEISGKTVYSEKVEQPI